MTEVLLVDWLGRGGIAQTTLAWKHVLADAGCGIHIVSRPDRELDAAGPRSGRNRIWTHRRLAHYAADEIRKRRPDVVVVQNFVIPALEGIVQQAAAATGARFVVVVHNHRAHSLVSGVRAGLWRLLARADDVVTHSHFVAERLRLPRRVSPTVLPLPIPTGVDPSPRRHSPLDAALTALHFGVVKRGYKGTDIVVDLARRDLERWRFVVAGVGAPAEASGIAVIPGYLSSDVLVDLVRQSVVTLLPYRRATQSAAVVLAQACGSVPIATAVGGIAEQIEDGVSGRLVTGGAGVDAWLEVLHELEDGATRDRLSIGARDRALAGHVAFRDGVRALVSPGARPSGPRPH